MIREVIRPSQCDLHITVPKEYLDKDVELIMFVLDETQTNLSSKSLNRERSSLRGVFNKYADTSKISLENNAWKKHVDEVITFDKKLNKCIAESV